MTVPEGVRRLAAPAAILAALLGGCSGKEPPVVSAPPAQGAGALPPALAPAPEFVPEDPAEVRRLAELEGARDRHRSLREAFAHGGRASPASRERLEAALRAIATVDPPRWSVSCRGRACRIRSSLPPQAWHPLLEHDPGVRQVVDRLSTDPDGVEAAAYVLLAEPGAADGDALLGAVAQELSGSEEARACAAKAGGAVAVRYELRVDSSGITYRSEGDLPREVLDCLDDVLGGILRTTPVPPTARSATRAVALRL